MPGMRGLSPKIGNKGAGNEGNVTDVGTGRGRLPKAERALGRGVLGGFQGIYGLLF